jgi:hypothetical protein
MSRTERRPAASRDRAKAALMSSSGYWSEINRSSASRAGPRVETRVGGGEFAATFEECRAWLEVGHVDVVQPDISRCGGLTEMLRVAQAAGHARRDCDPALLEDGHQCGRRPALPGCYR